MSLKHPIKNIKNLVKVGIIKSGKSYILRIYFEKMKSSIKCAIVMLITPIMVSRPKMMVLFHCVGKISKIYCLHFFYCSLLFENNKTMGFPGIDKGMLIALFLFVFWI